MTKNRLALWCLVAIPASVVAGVFIVPMFSIFLSSVGAGQPSLTLDYYHTVFTNPRYLNALLDTMRISAIVTVVCVIAGYIVAYCIVTQIKSSLLRRLAYITIVLPLFTSNIVRSFGFMLLLGRKGPVNESLIGSGLIEKPLRLLYNEFSVVLGLAYISLPFVVLAIVASLQAIKGELASASSDLGATPAGTFWHVTLPLSLPGVVSGAVLAFTLCVSAYVTPSVMFGGRGTVMSIEIYDQYMSASNFPMGAALAICLTIAAILVVAIQVLIFNRSMRWASA